ncbi:MAG: hypothetical protein R3266_06145 [Gemmatimonadota bacterium]|nr:hypothetical protein [Gemmatimonadota bacterium]
MTTSPHRICLLSLVFAVLAAACESGAERPRFDAEDYELSRPPPAGPRLAGANYTHHSFEDCSWEGSGLLTSYHRADVAERVHRQLRHMRESGIGSLRLLIWHMTDIPRQRWGVVPSRGGRLGQPYRDNLIALVTEIRRFGFERLTISFSPQWTNSPLRDNYDPRRLDENWSFIRDVRDLVTEHGPAETAFDLLNEGAPSDHLPAVVQKRMTEYIGRLWDRYAAQYGIGDVGISVIAPRDSRDRGHRLANLLDLYEEAGHGQPRSYEVHLNFAPAEVLFGLSAVDSVLSSRGLDGPLVIGEISYGDSAVAASVGAFLSDSPRPLREILQWVAAIGDSCPVSPPYVPGPYRTP